MRTLVFDTETTGLVDFKKLNEWKCQPHLVQLGALLVENGVIHSSLSLLVNPGVPVPVGASKVHGITSAITERYGVRPKVAVSMFNNFLKLADRIVGHNIDFDLVVMEVAYSRENLKSAHLDKAHLPRVCTMNSSAKVIDLPPTEKMIAAQKKYGFPPKPKPPKLEEAVKFFFNEELEGAHDALVDVLATYRVLQELERRGVKLKGGKQ
jgi:DNA polymerase-3 subunit epsilon